MCTVAWSKKKKIYFTFTLLYLFFILSCFSPFSVSLSLSISFSFLLEHSQTLSLWPPWMKPSSSASFSHGHNRHHQRRWWFLIFLSLKPRPKCLDCLSKRRSWKAEAKDTNGCGFLLFYYNKKRIIKKKEKKRVQWERNLPILLICSLNLQQWDFGTVSCLGFHFCCVFWFGCIDFSAFFFSFFFPSSLVLMGTAGLWLCSDFHGIDSCCGGVLVVEWNIILL